MEELEVVEQRDLRGYLQILSRRKLIIAMTVVVTVGLALAYSLVKTPIYSATATVLVPQQQAASALNIQNSQLPAAQSLQRSLSDEQQFARGDAVKEAAKSQLGYAAPISVGASSSADVLSFTGHSTDKTAAAAIANAYANGYITARRANQVAQYTEQVTALQTSIAQLQARADAVPASNPQRAALQQSVTSLTQTVQQIQAAAQLVGQTGPTVINSATVPTSPTSPKPVRNAILGVLIGLIIGVGLAFLVDRLDDGINSRDVAERAASPVPVVGLIPMVDAWRAKGGRHLALIEDPGSNASEAYRTLRTAIQFLSIDEPKHVIGITSSVPDEGKTTAVANLAVSFARAGQRVIVVSCDLRRPHVHQFFGIDNGTGLTSVLIREAPLREAVRAIDGETRLRLVPSGPVPPNPAEILSLDRVRQVIDVLAANSDVVLLDCPPVLPVTDALLLSRLVDGMLVLASARSTSRRDLRRTIQLLQQVEAPVLGVILNRVPAAGGYAYGYGYSYGYNNRHDEIGRAQDRANAEATVPSSPGTNGSLRSGGQAPASAGRAAPDVSPARIDADWVPSRPGASSLTNGSGSRPHSPGEDGAHVAESEEDPPEADGRCVPQGLSADLLD